MKFNHSRWVSDIQLWWKRHASDLKTTAIIKGVKAGYLMLVASAFLPLLSQSGLDGLAVALTSLVGGVGAELLSNIIQDTHDNVVKQLVRQSEDKEIRQLIEIVIEQGQAVQAAHHALGSEWKRFSEMVVADIQAFGEREETSPTISLISNIQDIHVEGDFNVAQGNITTVSRGGVAVVGDATFYITPFGVARDTQYLRSEEMKVRDDGSVDAQRVRIFISYVIGIEPDEAVALQLAEALSQHHDVFIDQITQPDYGWAGRIKAELCRSHFLIALLSAESVKSEMIEVEISTAYHLARLERGYPMILPVRLGYQAPFPYPLNAYLDTISWAFWESEEDTPKLIAELENAIRGEDLKFASMAEKAKILRTSQVDKFQIPGPQAYANPLPIPLERPDGTMDPESRFYIERLGDEVLTRELSSSGTTVVIKAPRQVGKSSLLARGVEFATQTDRDIAYLDFQLLDGSMLQAPHRFFKGFCRWIAYELSLEDKVEEFWKIPLGNVQLCTLYFQRHILNVLDKSLMLAMDEVDRMFECYFRSDFFGMLRHWHNSRRPRNSWGRLDLVLVISTEPYMLIDNATQSPFNVGEVITLEDFSVEQVNHLNYLHNTPFSQGQLEELFSLIGGHPYLVRQALYRVAIGQLTANELLVNASTNNSPFADHLHRHLLRFAHKPHLQQAMLQVINSHTRPSEESYHCLKGAGLVRSQSSLTVLPRCRLYAEYFGEHLSG